MRLGALCLSAARGSRRLNLSSSDSRPTELSACEPARRQRLASLDTDCGRAGPALPASDRSGRFYPLPILVCHVLHHAEENRPFISDSLPFHEYRFQLGLL